tara:strand:- start:204 stop:764 length:561 start_codon:yes stop_codon:yes gene_type:complete
LVAIIIGLTGKNAAGKGTVADILSKKEFVYHSLSDSLRDELKLLGKEVTRDNLIEIGNKLRKEGGPGVLADKMRLKLGSDKNHIVDSIRNPFEVNSLREDFSSNTFILISVDADARLRYDRLCSRGRIGDSDSWESFVNQEKQEENNDDPNKQQLSKTMNMADYSIDNSGSLESLEKQVRKILSKL